MADQGKAILKSALEPYLDRDILYRRKQGFEPPLGEWMRGPLTEMIEDLLFGPSPDYADYLDRPALEKAWRDHRSGRRNYTPLIWAVLVLELWFRKFVRCD